MLTEGNTGILYFYVEKTTTQLEYEIRNRSHHAAEIWEVTGHRVGYLVKAPVDGWHIFDYVHDHTSLKASKNIKTALRRFIKYQLKNSPTL